MCTTVENYFVELPLEEMEFVKEVDNIVDFVMAKRLKELQTVSNFLASRRLETPIAKKPHSKSLLSMNQARTPPMFRKPVLATTPIKRSIPLAELTVDAVKEQLS